MTENTTKDSVVLTIERKKKRRRRGILFSSRKQLERARMGRRKRNITEADISVVAKVLSYNLEECGSDGALLDILENDRDSIVSIHRVLSCYIALEVIVESIMLVLKKQKMLLIDFSAKHLLEDNRSSFFCKR